MSTAGVATAEGDGLRGDRPIEREVRQSLTLLVLTAAAMGLYLGVGLLAVRVLG